MRHCTNCGHQLGFGARYAGVSTSSAVSSAEIDLWLARRRHHFRRWFFAVFSFG
jgi:hypothetical protein